MSEDTVIQVSHVSKNFKLPHEKTNSVKNLFIHALRNISSKRTYETQHALRDVSFEVKKGEFFGIVGRNGSGKSTLLKILAGIYQPTKGTVHKAGRLVPFIELGVGFNPELTGRQNVYLNGALLGFSEKEVDELYPRIVAFAELGEFMDQKLKNYSSGMQVRLAFSVAVQAQADILLIDEVLAVGDADFQRKCFTYFKNLKKEKTTVIFVSHNMDAVREFCDRAMLIEKNKIVGIGPTNIITHKYSQLFIEDEGINEVKSENKNENRWGSGAAVIQNVEAKLENNYLKVESEIHVKKQVDKIVYGIHVVSSDGTEITAVNNKMIHQPSIEGVRPDDVYKVKWEMLNVFNDGRYTIMLTLIDDLANTLDWFADAAEFSVKRPERSTTSVLPPLKVEINQTVKKKG